MSTSPDPLSTNPDPLDAFIRTWSDAGAAERQNYQLFLMGLCELLDLPRPEPARPDAPGDYVFERSVSIQNGDGSTTTGRIDLYRRGAFVLETKQGVTVADDPVKNPLAPSRPRRVGHGVRGSKGWDESMIRARAQAENYAKHLPPGEQWPPFVIVSDVGYSIELFADFSRSGRPYLGFPAHGEHRIVLDDLRRPEVRDRLRAVWLDPTSLDPSRRAARVTRDVAARLAELAKLLEADGHDPEPVAHFLMRCLFTMFAEDVGLLPSDGFRQMLVKIRDDRRLDILPAKLRALWDEMNRGGFSAVLDDQIRQFNGGLFAESDALPLSLPQLNALIDAASAEWSEVEPAIFGTLLERALEPRERHKLGAHYTPRAYVERLVLPTVIEPLREQWADAQAEALQLDRDGKQAEAIKTVERFLHHLCGTTVLDPACGTGNFLYVTMEHMKRLEGEVWDVLRGLGRRQEALGLAGETVGPGQFLGIELNPRAAAIADLVLWIGYLQWHLRTFGVATVPEPVLLRFDNIENRDAVLAYDRVEPVLDPDTGQPVTRWDGHTTKPHPVTGQPVPDDSARVPVLRYLNPRKADWPKADYVVGNPPFIGAGPLRQAVGDGYAEALRKTHNDVPESVDFVVYWWNHAAHLARQGAIQRFGFIATNSLRQTFNRRVLQGHIFAESDPLSITYAVPDHPWVDTADGANVRISMTVGQRGRHKGLLARSVDERLSGSEEVDVDLARSQGMILSDLTIGADVAGSEMLQSNFGLSNTGVKLHGAGFIVTPEEAESLGLGKIEGIENHIKQYRHGKDVAQ
ncbi:class I SAM-dependent DNA methyltransferase [Tautonia rosea]|uniref:class I SAM-dependent DNA methyltransferase n=1 Tax=Tautonia rosea TaxID=2728037 RepID=UPI0019D03658|nr:DNA methyltransferase [Tautonia rosea]